MSKGLSIAISLSLLMNTPVCFPASVYKCKDAMGSVTYSEFPCEKDEEVKTFKKKERKMEVEIPDKQSTKKTNEIITEAQLQGTWWELEKGGTLSRHGHLANHILFLLNLAE